MQRPPRNSIYFGTGVAIAVIGIAFQSSSWRSSAELHTLMELAATLLALMAGLVAIIRFHAKKSNTFLFLGIGFFGTALLDAYHTVVTSSFFAEYLPSSLTALIPWSWNASRTFLSIVMLLSWWAWRREARQGVSGQISEKVVYSVVGVLTFVTFVFFTTVPLPRAYYPECFFGRPEEFVAALLFGLALAGYLQKQSLRERSCESWVVLSLVIGFVCQAVVISRSFVLFDAMFDFAHVLKIVSYACVLIGLHIDIYGRIRREKLVSEKLAIANAELKNAVAHRDLALCETEEIQQELRLAATAFQTAAKIIITDADANILRVNSGFTRVTGFTEEEAIGANPRFLQSGRHDKQFYKEMWETLRKEGVWEGEIWDRRKDGREIAERVVIAAVKNKNGETTHYVASGQDITELKSTEIQLVETNKHLEAKTAELAAANQELTNSNEQLQQFAYVASHDLQEPLRKVTSFCQILQKEYGDALDDDAHTYINFAVDGAKRMRDLVSDLLEYSRVETQGVPLAPTDVDNACCRAIDNLQFAIEETGAAVTRGPLPIINADCQQLVRLFQNLVGNAIKYRAERPLEINIGAEERDDEWVFHVRDNGMGIESQYYDRIFQIFQRLHGRNEYSGTGIGLAICRRIVDRLDGHIWVESRPNYGSTFFFAAPKLPPETYNGVDQNECDHSDQSLATVG